ncbi:MAG: hypothetical protein HYU36_14795 [Planctomycetes bacterium]|nr:hypothetical protein [Planctomycetota bacterium]
MVLFVLILACVDPAPGEGQREVTFSTPDGGRISGRLYGQGRQGVVLVPPALQGMEFWDSLGKGLAQLGFAAVTFDPRGRNESKPGKDPAAFEMDVLGAVNVLRAQKAAKVCVLGTAGAAATVAAAAAADRSSRIQQIILLSPGPCEGLDRSRAQLLLIGSKDEKNAKYADQLFQARKEEAQYEVFLGQAHGQELFVEKRGEKVLELIVEFLGKGPRKGMRRHD